MFLPRLLGDLALSTQNLGQSLGTTVPFSRDLVTEHILWLILKRQLFAITSGTLGEEKNSPSLKYFPTANLKFYQRASDSTECLKPPVHTMMEGNRENQLEQTMIQAVGVGASQTQGFRTGRLGAERIQLLKEGPWTQLYF